MMVYAFCQVLQKLNLNKYYSVYSFTRKIHIIKQTSIKYNYNIKLSYYKIYKDLNSEVKYLKLLKTKYTLST